MIIKQTFSNHLNVLWIAIFTTMLFIVVCWYFDFKRDVLYFGLGYYCLTVVPSFYLHIRYYIKNKGMVCQILPGRICIRKDGKDKTIKLDNIKSIVVYKSASIEKGSFPITPMEAYFFVRIFDKSENSYDLTCLMDTNIDKKIKDMGAVSTFVERGMFNNV